MGIRFHYEDFGSGRAFFGLHGWPLDHRHMVAEYEPLFANRSGWRRIYMDLPGMGQTPGADWINCQDQMLDVLVGFIEKVAPGERFIVGGTSYGGYLARGLVYRRSEKMDGMMINVPVAEMDKAKRRLPEHRLIHANPDFLAALEADEQEMKEPGSTLSAQSVPALEHLRKYYKPAGAIADDAFLERVSKQSSFSFTVDVLPQPFDAPSLILTGRFDHWCGYREAYSLLDQYTRATFAVLDRADHALVVEENNLFLALANDWLDRVEEYIKDRGN
ncbi:MAG: alpha/beta fold hydrolase [Omnitrophica WOR_2 bacterium]